MQVQKLIIRNVFCTHKLSKFPAHKIRHYRHNSYSGHCNSNNAFCVALKAGHVCYYGNRYFTDGNNIRAVQTHSAFITESFGQMFLNVLFFYHIIGALLERSPLYFQYVSKSMGGTGFHPVPPYFILNSKALSVLSFPLYSINAPEYLLAGFTLCICIPNGALNNNL